eukprot:GFYU01015827.1.p1 GENE.GFYU01015827.1~~GFYU01015827.1.p1  ORF type:complete len:393 (-),score=90.10 GFYU01015827.1:622-1644(-)
MEDDVKFCEGSAPDITWIFSWAASNWHDWNMIRTGPGVNGLILKCEDLDPLIDFVGSMINYPGIDEHLDTFFAETNRHMSLIYHRNIIYHSPANPSSIWEPENDAVRLFAPCLGSLFGLGIKWDYQYDADNCTNRYFSPCSANSIPYVNPPLPDPTFDFTGEVILSAAGLGQSCTEHCLEINARCAEELFDMVNNCPMMQARFKCSTCKAPSQLQRDQPFYIPSYDLCEVSATTIPTCDASLVSWTEIHRYCPCEFLEMGSIGKRGGFDSRETYERVSPDGPAAIKPIDFSALEPTPNFPEEDPQAETTVDVQADEEVPIDFQDAPVPVESEDIESLQFG